MHVVRFWLVQNDMFCSHAFPIAQPVCFTFIPMPILQIHEREIWEINECDTKSFGTSHGTEKMIAVTWNIWYTGETGRGKCI